MAHFNRLKEAEAERLAVLAEECAEVIQAITKIQRHGFESYDPTNRNGPTNREMLAAEMGDLGFALELVNGNDVEPIQVTAAHQRKRRKINKWLHHNEVGTGRVVDPLLEHKLTAGFYQDAPLEPSASKSWR